MPEGLKLGMKIRGAAFVVAISDFGRSQLYRWSRLEEWPKIHVVRCAVDGRFLGSPRTPTPSAPRLLHVGRLSEQKGQLLLLEALSRVARANLAFELIVIGDGPMRGALEQRARELGVEDRVRFKGLLDGSAVRAEILASRALVMASFAEGLPVVIMEALACGRAVVATSIAGIPELVEPGVSGWLVPAGSTDRLADALRSALVASPAELDRMGEAGAAKVAAAHEASREAAKLAALFREKAGRDG